MAKRTKQDKMYVRPTPEARHALKTVLVALESPALFGPELTQEDFVSATWLWLVEMRPADVAAAVAPHLEKVRASRAKARAEGLTGPGPGLLPPMGAKGEDEDVPASTGRRRKGAG